MRLPHILLLLAACLVTSACSKQEYGEVPVYPVSGTVTVKGQPAAGATVVFHPRGDVGMTKGNKPFARVGEDGSFHATTYVSNDGAPAGEYTVTVVWPQNPNARGPSPDRLQNRYSSPTDSKLTATVTEGENKLPPWDL